jgi:hypothetical protein
VWCPHALLRLLLLRLQQTRIDVRRRHTIASSIGGTRKICTELATYIRPGVTEGILQSCIVVRFSIYMVFRVLPILILVTALRRISPKLLSANAQCTIPKWRDVESIELIGYTGSLCTATVASISDSRLAYTARWVEEEIERGGTIREWRRKCCMWITRDIRHRCPCVIMRRRRGCCRPPSNIEHPRPPRPKSIRPTVRSVLRFTMRHRL